MRRCWMLLPLLAAGCSTHPVADLLDIVNPAPPFVSAAVPAAPPLPAFAAVTTPPATGPVIPPPPAAPPPAWPGG
jgi:hypothetical protein